MISSEILDSTKYDGIIVCVGHKEFLKMDLKSLVNASNIIFDVKGFLNPNDVDGRL